MAEQLFGSPGTSVVRLRSGKSGSRSALDNPGSVHCVAPPVEGKPKCVDCGEQLETKERQKRLPATSVLEAALLSRPVGRNRPETHVDQEYLSACIKLWRTLCWLFQKGDHSNLLVCTCRRRFRKRKEITESKPLAMRLASCKGAEDRAAAKRLACQETVERALQEFQQAQQRERELGRN